MIIMIVTYIKINVLGKIVKLNFFSFKQIQL